MTCKHMLHARIVKERHAPDRRKATLQLGTSLRSLGSGTKLTYFPFFTEYLAQDHDDDDASHHPLYASVAGGFITL